jgi:hypothetical protein
MDKHEVGKMDTVTLLAQLVQQGQRNHDELVSTMNSRFSELSSALSAHTLEDTRQFAEIDKRLQPIEGLRRGAKTLIILLIGQALSFFGMLAAYALHIRK